MPIFLFPGQGAQFPGMGIDLFNADFDGSMGIRSLFETASEVLGQNIQDILNSDTEFLKRTDISQPAITVVSLAASLYLKSRNIIPTACAGFSLGEYPALAVSGVLSITNTIKLVMNRGKIMQDACGALKKSSSVPPGMIAILGLSPEQVDRVIADFPIEGLFAANYNSPKQTVVSGTADALSLVEEIFKKAGARRVVTLKVAGPFHSPLMRDAADSFAKTLNDVIFTDPVLPLYSNVTGLRITSGEEAKKNALLHISNPVLWTKEEQSIAFLMAENGDDTLIEVGPGSVLAGLWRDSRQKGFCTSYTEFMQVDA